MSTITTIGLDIAKSSFTVHGEDAEGHAVIRKDLKRKDVLGLFGCCGSGPRDRNGIAANR